MANEVVEYRTWGPPGCGKTHEVQRLAEDIYHKYGADAALIVSFTKTAAQEIIKRIPDTNREMVGTLHAICYRALNRPTIAETKIAEFAAAHPQYATSGAMTVDVDDPYAGEDATAEIGDKALETINVLRARMVPEEAWPGSARAFWKAWSIWKESCGYLDFTDLIDICRRDVEKAPGDPQVGIVDECQDSPKLQLALLRTWASHMYYLMVVGDSDQCLFRWSGANPADFVEHPVPAERRKVLSQSYRVPRAVHTVAMALRGQMSQHEDGEYFPRDADGEVRRLSANYKQPEMLLEAVQPYLDNEKSVMVLASCSYMLDPFKALLKREGIPFCNEFRPRRGDWNPLSAGNGLSAAERLALFLRTRSDVWGDEARTWTRAEVYQWSRILRADGVFLPRKRLGIEAWKMDHAPASLDDLCEYFTPESVDSLLFDADESWYAERLLTSKEDAMRYPLAVAQRYGAATLRAKPRLTIGTVHSVKGGQADCVLVIPDLSRAGMCEWVTAGEDRDNVLRVFYVAVTRARETLLLCERASSWAASI